MKYLYFYVYYYLSINKLETSSNSLFLPLFLSHFLAFHYHQIIFASQPIFHSVGLKHPMAPTIRTTQTWCWSLEGIFLKLFQSLFNNWSPDTLVSLSLWVSLLIPMIPVSENHLSSKKFYNEEETMMICCDVHHANQEPIVA